MLLNKPSDAHKISLTEENMEKNTLYEFIEKLQAMDNHKVHDALKKFQDNTNKEIEETQKQLKILSKDFNTKVKQRRQ
jgi:formate dehydrogenase maturation protein FdhE